jgi:hypothetical protein
MIRRTLILLGDLVAIVAVLVVTSMLMGCATAKPPAPRVEPTFGCLPKGLSLDGVRIVAASVGNANATVTGLPVPISIVHVEQDGKDRIVVFIGAEVASVDMEPNNQAVPILVNVRWFGPTGKQIDPHPALECAWRPVGEPALEPNA